jgi:hypothetical protein
MLATRQVLGGFARPRSLISAASGIRRLATVSDSPLDKKVCHTEHNCLPMEVLFLTPRIGPPEQLGGEQLHQLQEDV